VLALAALQVSASGVGPETADGLAPCPHPHEVAAVAGHTRRVSCHEASADAPVRGPARVLFGLGIDPNRASASTLEALPGVGPARAAAIVAGRAEGAYRSLRDLRRVPGVGPVTLRRSAPWLVFEAAEAFAPEPDTLSSPPDAAARPGEDAP